MHVLIILYAASMQQATRAPDIRVQTADAIDAARLKSMSWSHGVF